MPERHFREYKGGGNRSTITGVSSPTGSAEVGYLLIFGRNCRAGAGVNVSISWAEMTTRDYRCDDDGE